MARKHIRFLVLGRVFFIRPSNPLQIDEIMLGLFVPLEHDQGTIAHGVLPFIPGRSARNAGTFWTGISR